MQIYRITNKLNNKIYIGQDTRNRKNYFGSGNLITRALKKYGKENFTKEILWECDTIEELNEKEIFFIAKYNSTHRRIGYNIVGGGYGSLGYDAPAHVRKKWSDRQRGEKNHFYGKKHSEEFKQKVSAKLKGRKLTPEHRENIGKGNTGKKRSPEHVAKMREQCGEKASFYGRKHTEETKAKLRDIKKAFSQTPEGKEVLRKLHANSGKYQRKTPGHMKGRKHTEEAKRNMSLGKLGKKHSEERKASRKWLSGENHPMYGKKLSPEAREKLSIAQKKRLQENPRPKGKDHWAYGKKMSPENKEKLRAVHKGKIVSEETRQKIREARYRQIEAKKQKQQSNQQSSTN